MASSLQFLTKFISRGTYAMDVKIQQALRYAFQRGAADNVVFNATATASVAGTALTAVAPFVLTNAAGFNGDNAVVGGRTYRFRAYIPCLANTTSGIQMDWSGGTATFTSFDATGFSYVGSTLTAAHVIAATGLTTNQTGVTTTIIVEGTFTASGSGSFGPRAALTTGVATTSFLAGGYVSLTEIPVTEVP